VAAAATAVAVIASPDKKNDDDYPDKVIIVEKIAKTIHGVPSFIDSGEENSVFRSHYYIMRSPLKCDSRRDFSISFFLDKRHLE